jgi:hypothetical protein
LGRWHVLDALADDSTQISFTPYHYGLCNPIVYIDPDGNICWKTVGSGLLGMAGGVSEVIIGAGIAGGTSVTGVGVIIGGALVVDGGVKTSLGFGQVLDGLLNNGDANIPGGMGEAIGMAVDAVIPGDGKSGEAIGTFVDIATGSVGSTSKVAVEGISKITTVGSTVLSVTEILPEVEHPTGKTIENIEKGEGND